VVEAGPLWRECVTRPYENASTLITIGLKALSFRLLLTQREDLHLNCGILRENYENETPVNYHEFAVGQNAVRCVSMA
jgi:hypothetical protein